MTSLMGAVVYVILFAIAPQNLHFLPHAWMITDSRLDFVYGLIIYLLNCHSFVDCFFATCGGFSVSLLVAILQQGRKPTSTDDLLARFRLQPQPEQRRMETSLGPVD